MEENFATVLETVADVMSERGAITQGDRVVTWARLDAAAARLAGHLSAAGIGPGHRVAICLFNSPEYFEAVFAALKCRAVPVNVNYRYKAEEMTYIFRDADVRAVLYDASVADRLGPALDGLQRRPALVQLGGTDLLDGAVQFEDALGAEPMSRIERGNDEWLMYTGGTTGMPRGVLSRHSWLFGVVAANGFLNLGVPYPQSLDELRTTLEGLKPGGETMVTLPGPPLMHGAGMYTSLGALLAGGRVACLTERGYDPDDLASTIERQRVDTVGIVGDVFAVPLADALDRAVAAGRPYDLSSLKRILSYGVMWSAESKARLLAHADFLCRDLVAATEGGPFAVAETRRGDPVSTARFRLLPGCRIIDDTGRDVEPGSGRIGRLAAVSDEHIRYLGDEAKTAETFRTIDGVRYVVPGDLVSIDADGVVTFHGRGSGVINSGGEKVFAEEVENCIRRHPAVRDVMVVGVPDPRWGHRIAAVVALQPGATLTLADLRAHVGAELADYKRPTALRLCEELKRSPSGKADLRWAAEVAAEAGDG
ncbi:MAG: AMP-binding protein [Dermatophilaceae bacterium]